MPEILFLPLNLLARLLYRIFYFSKTYHQKYSVLAKSNMAQSLIQMSVLSFLYLLQVNPLLSLILTDFMVFSLPLFILMKGEISMIRQKFSLNTCKESFRHWHHLPQFSLPNACLSVLALTIPTLTLPLYLPLPLAGQILFAFRLLEFPFALLSSVATPFFQNQIVKGVFNEEKKFYKFIALTAIIFISFIPIIFIQLPTYFDKWKVSLEILPILCFYAIGLTVFSVLIDLLNSKRSERKALPVHIIYLSGVILLFSFGAITEQSYTWILSLYSLITLLKAFTIFHIIRSATQYDE